MHHWDRTSGNGFLVTLTYISSSTLQSRNANAIHSMKMAQTLSKIADETLAIFISNAGVDDVASLKSLYGVAHLPMMMHFPSRGRYGLHLFNFRAAFYAWKQNSQLVLSRSIGAAAFCAYLGIPTIFECHAPPLGGENLYWKVLIKSTNFRRLVLISDALADIMAKNFPVRSHTEILVARDGVDISQYSSIPDAESAKMNMERDPDRPVAGYAGHLYKGRGIDIILGCASKLPNWDFLIAGGAETDIANLRAEVEKKQIDNIEILGFVPNENLPAQLAIADVLLMPYQNSVMVSDGVVDTVRWMSPLKMFEYMAMRRAIISSDLPVLREVLNDQSACLVAPGDTQQWVNALISLGEDVSKRNGLAAEAYRAVQQFSWSKRCHQIFDGLLPIADPSID